MYYSSTQLLSGVGTQASRLNVAGLVIITLCWAGVAQAETPKTALPVVAGTSIPVKVIEVTPEGVQRPLAGAQAWLVAIKRKPGPHRAKVETVGRWMARSDEQGQLLFRGVQSHPGASYQVLQPFQGVSYRSAEFSLTSPPREIRVYHLSQNTEGIGMRVHWTISVGEIYLRVSQVIRVENSGMTTVDYTHSLQGLRVPTLSYMIGARVMTHGMFPPGTLHGNPAPSTGQGRIEAENGAVVYRGPVEPGNRLFFELSYNIPFKNQAARLGAVSDVPILDAAASVRWGHMVSPKVRLESKHRAIWRKQASFTEVDLLQVGNLEPGQPLVVNLNHLPIQSNIPQWIAGVIGVLALALFILLVMGFAMRRRSEVA
ncbi:MAG TPA: hypothetical protein EYN06_00710 [Myxococcales bacterium]|nr:hypothetical protein [Myxococcales bacterium]HIN84969.1 hypothetical protein [Myxococcales bacterium]